MPQPMLREVWQLLWCARCGHRLCPQIPSTDVRQYLCANSCRLVPVNGPWLESQIMQALAGKVPATLASVAIERITVGDQAPGGVKLTWRRRFPTRPQPSATNVPSTIFVPVRT